jgi:hypothetical protein
LFVLGTQQTRIRMLFPALRLLSFFGLVFLSFYPAQASPAPPEKPKFSLQVIEKRVQALFKDQKWYESADFPWDSTFSQIGTTPEIKTVLGISKKTFRFNCPENSLSNITTPRQLVKQLFEILNNGVYFYEKPDFEGPSFILYAPKNVVTDLNLDIKFLHGSCIKPAGYETKIEFGPNVFVKFGGTNTQWDAPNIREKVPDEVFGKKFVKVRLSR